MSNVIKQLEQIRSAIKFEGPEDEGADEWYTHISVVIDALNKGLITVEEAGDSLGMELK